ncbi:E3 SUMO-protein ligase ZNF451 isoform X2 [Antennarius striatus]|uniref:E3 SUMO-protein ligase ZNF451 isoform X2 n=1 Tax=Antennarius striatus TaxID=241820 RepID=UPI0035AFF829
MSSPVQTDEDEVEEVEFVSEGPVKPVSECIDLTSNSEDEGCSSSTLEDKITCHKARVTSTLERLAQKVAQEKQQRANKCRAFKERQMLQKAHGQRELAFSSGAGSNQEAKRCVDMWLKMPGVKPGGVSSGFRRQVFLPGKSSTRHTCPVISCGRVFDNVPLLDGHLKRFDHSPCDPTISLKGCPSELFACAACGQHFLTKDEWKIHLESKVSSSTPGSHSLTQTYQRIVCFACPACYLFFNLRDECLKHMLDKNHFSESLAMNETRERALPVPIPQYVKNHLISLCKSVKFRVQCSLCYKILTSHHTAQAHFNVQCRQGCAVAKADKTVTEVMKELQVRGQCTLCCKLFFREADIESHKRLTQHDVEVNRTMEKAVLQHCRFRGAQQTWEASEVQRENQHSFPKRNSKRSNCLESPAKRQRLGASLNVSSQNNLTAWRCECGLQFVEKAAATKHLLAVNQIFHQCGVCGKHMGESSIARLHMSRFHGGAHLSNFLFYCRKCKVEMPQYEDALSHLSQNHSGHTYFSEQEVSEEAFTTFEAKLSNSKLNSFSIPSTVKQETVEKSPLKTEQTWMCRMCEDVFDSEDDVRQHCSDVSSHSYQRYMCGHCPQKFFKESTIRRHCMNEHDGQIKSHHYCGLCDSMQFESEGEFLEHYERVHSKDYYCIEEGEGVQPSVTESTGQLVCPCMGSEKRREEMKATYTQCMRDLAHEEKCQYVCPPCNVSVPSYAQMKTHVHVKHPALNLDKTFEIECKICQESYRDVPSFHKHYHFLHCSLEPCVSSRTQSRDTKAEPTSVKVINAMEINPHSKEIDDETLVKFLNMEQTNKETETRDDDEDKMNSMSEEARESAELEEALQRSLLEF